MALEMMGRLESVNKKGKGEVEEAVQAVVNPSTALNKMNEQLELFDNTKSKHVTITEEHNGSFREEDLSAGFDKRTMKETHTNLAGVIFMCNKRTMKECFYHSLFGLPYNMWHLVRQVVPGTILFLFEYEARKMWGIYEASSYGKLNIERSPYSKGSFPAQVRFKEVECCSPLEEDEFKDAIRENYFSDFKFQFDLSHDQVYKLCKAFLWKSATQNKNSMPNFKASEVEKYAFDYSLSTYEGQQHVNVPVDKSLNACEGQQHGSIQSSPRQLQAALYTVYDDLFSDGWLQSDAHGMPYVERGFPDRFVKSSYTNDIHENNWNRNELFEKQVMHASSDKVSDFPSFLNRGLSVDKNRIRPLVGMLQTSQYSPSVSTQLMHEKMTDVGARGMCRAGLEPYEYAEGFSRLHADRLNHKPSVWSRISARVIHDEVTENRLGTPKYNYVSGDEITEKDVDVPNYDGIVGAGITNRGSRLPDYLTPVSAEVRGTEVSQACDEDYLGGLGKTDCTVEELRVSDLVEVGFPVSFKRRKRVVEVESPQETGKPQRNKRRKITRPDFSDASESMEEWEKEYQHFKNMKPGTDEQLDHMNLKKVEGEQCTKICSPTNSTLKEFHEAFQSSIRNERSLCSTPFEGMENENLNSGHVCKLQDGHAEIHFACDCRDAGPVTENKDTFNLGREISALNKVSPVKNASWCEVHPLQKAPMVNVFSKKTADSGDVPGNQCRENDPTELDSADSATVIHTFNILDVADGSIVRAEDLTGKMIVDQSEIDLNQPICQSGSELDEKDLVHCFSGGSNTSAYAFSSYSSRDGPNCQTGGLEPCLDLELTMGPGAISSTNSSGMGKGGSPNKNLVSVNTTTEENTDLELTIVSGGLLSANVDEMAMRECSGKQGSVPKQKVLD